ncbi:alpha/beta hydrolase [Myxococcus faecalis]|uniref:alpha/beta fold hydrolase n=1 Tax=Myxococcus TaxID=32 RepID=UPI001CBDEA2D|nr:alpha/beta hydrolase [Myxococcus sp. AS-1-15]MBZ4399320.1 alpha/beta hydrolase [Myxococcus sp. AS-1-15]BDT30505.1 alpha/beta hydrolase [Myxococcus sp. MH1]
MNWREWQGRQEVMESGGHFVSYVDWGKGPPVVLLHGIPTWSYLWSGLARALAASHRVLVPDLLGYGFSDRRDRFDRSVTRQAEVLEAWMERLGVVDAAVVGHDVGGGVAQQLAVRYPRRVSRLCLMDSVCYDAWPLALMSQLGTPGMARKLSPERMTKLLRLGLKKKGFVKAQSAELLEGLLAPYTTEVGWVSLSRNAVALNTNQTQELAPKLGQLAVPTLVMWGAEDGLLPAKYGERLVWDIPGARWMQVPDAGHFVMWDAPHTVAMELFRFIEGASPVNHAQVRTVAEELWGTQAPVA